MSLSVPLVALMGLAVLLLIAALRRGVRLLRRTQQYSRTGYLLLGLLGVLIAGVLIHAYMLLGQVVTLSDLFVAILWVIWGVFVWVALMLTRAVVDRFAYVAAMERHRAKHDELTSLPNRDFFTDFLERAIREHQGEADHQIGVILLDLNRFKAVNDQMGQGYGDILLKEIGYRLHRSLRRTDMLARLGGDEFGVIVENVRGREQARAVAHHLVLALGKPFAVHGEITDVGVSVGVAWCPEHGREPTLLLKRAKLALRTAKRKGMEVAEFKPTMERKDPDRLHILSELREAIGGKRLIIHYQPQIDLASGRIAGFEALVRWPHSRLGLLSPDEFVPLAEENGMIGTLSRLVFDRVLDQLREWHDEGVDLPISTNVSPMNLVDESFYTVVRDGLARRGLVPGRLHLEVTESAAVADLIKAREVMDRLISAGVNFAIDDFGTGYASLDYLKSLPVSEVKLDKSFILNLTEEGEDAAIVRSTIDLAHKLGRKVTAEGVETKEVLDLLKRWGCDRAQGYYVGEPSPVANLATPQVPLMDGETLALKRTD